MRPINSRQLNLLKLIKIGDEGVSTYSLGYLVSSLGVSTRHRDAPPASGEFARGFRANPRARARDYCNSPHHFSLS